MMMARLGKFLMLAAAASLSAAAAAQVQPAGDIPATKYTAPTAGYDYVKRVVMVPMREHHDLTQALMARLAALKIAFAGLPAEAGLKYPSELSGGMVKRAALARSLALDPDILFLDEPTAGLDPIGAAAFDQLILTLRESLGLTVFLITHDLDTLYTICDRVAVIAQKRVLIADTLDKVERFDDPWVQDYFQGPRGRAAEHAATARASVPPSGP